MIPSTARQVRLVQSLFDARDVDVFNPSAKPGVTIVALVSGREADELESALEEDGVHYVRVGTSEAIRRERRDIEMQVLPVVGHEVLNM